MLETAQPNIRSTTYRVFIDEAVFALVGLWKKSGTFALNMLGEAQQGAAFAFFKPAELDSNKISGEPFRAGGNGAPILDSAQASAECKLVEVVEQGDHHIVVAEVTEANVAKPPEGRADAAILEMNELDDNVFYGGKTHLPHEN